jgi:crotonobetainyl-CoA:carnitine CoA-transferase CaiB-like acyl-CoA transferase
VTDREAQTDSAEGDPHAPALASLRVLDVGGSMTAYAARLLADLGADVVEVEPPEGDRLRRSPPFDDGTRGPDASLLFAYYRATQRGVTLATARSESVDLLHELGSDADIVLMSPSRRQPLAGWDADACRLAWSRDDAIVTSITPYGLTGPYRDWRSTPMVSYAMTGLMHRTGDTDGPPLAPPGRQQWDEAGAHAVLAVLAALWCADRVGGQVIDISVHEVGSLKDFLVERYAAEGKAAWGRALLVGVPPTGVYQCVDGPFDVAAHQTHHWEAFLTMLGHPDELSEPSLADAVVRRDLFDGLLEIIQGLVGDRKRGELVELGQAAHLPCSMLLTPAEFAHDDHIVARHTLVPTPTAGSRTVDMPGPAHRSEPSAVVPRRAAPRLGEHNHEIYVGQLGHTDAEMHGWREDGLV